MGAVRRRDREIAANPALEVVWIDCISGFLVGSPRFGLVLRWLQRPGGPYGGIWFFWGWRPIKTDDVVTGMALGERDGKVYYAMRVPVKQFYMWGLSCEP